ncbi:MAG: acyltransferase [Bacteroidota bacterium]
MIRNLFIRIVRQKNPQFQLDPQVGLGDLWGLIIQKMISRIRGFRLYLSGHWTGPVFLGRSVRIFGKGHFRFGPWLQLEEGVYLHALSKEGLHLGSNVRIGPYCRLECSGSYQDLGKGIRIGNNVGLGAFAFIGGAGGVEIGDDCIIGQYLSCHPENHLFDDTQQLIRLQGHSRKGIRIGNNCWIGAKVTVLDGVEVGEHCVIAAGAVVTKDFPPYSVIGGVPARLIQSIKKEKVDLNPQTLQTTIH